MDPGDFAARLDVWVRMGLRALDTLPLGLGRTVGAIVRTKDYLDDPEKKARMHWVKGNFNAAPNGSLMRTHPVGLMCLNKTVEETYEAAAKYSVVTHVDPRCVVSCVIGTALVRGLVRGEVRTETDVDAVIEHATAWYVARRNKELEDPERKDEPGLDVGELKTHATVRMLDDLNLDDSYKIGYVYKCFGSGVLLLRQAMRQTAQSSRLQAQSQIFEPLVTDLIMRGGDADTNACFAGALLGSYLGYKALPPHWRDGLRYGEFLMGKAEGLCEVLGVTEGEYSGSGDEETAVDGGRGMLTDGQVERKVMEMQAWMAQLDVEARKREEAGRRKSSWLPWK